MVQIVAMGDNVVDCYVSTGQMYPGGNCLNVSVFARRFGAETQYLGAIGKDAAGNAIQAALAAEGVGTDRLRVLDGPTGWCLIGHEDGDRVFLRYDLGVSMFQPVSADIAFLRTYDAVHVGRSSGLDGSIAAIAAAAPLSYDFSTHHDPRHMAVIAPLCFLACTSGGALSADEATALVHQLLDGGAKWALVTRGRDGALLGHAGTVISATAAPAQVVDTLGAGDTTIARVLYGLLAGEDGQTALNAAMQAAAQTCTYYGAVGHGVAIDLDTALPELADQATV